MRYGLIELQEQPYTCTHCGKSFMKEKTSMAHMCERKRRAMQKDEKRVQAGYMVYNRFFELTQGQNKPKSYEDFCNSSYYNAFVKFGSYINNINPIYPNKFVDHIIKGGIKLDNWCRDEHYERYLFDMLKVEPVESAVQRSLQTMLEWGEEHNADFNHYFLYASLNRAVNDIRNGRISCWILLNSKSGKEMVAKMNDEQLNIIAPAFDIKYWMKKFRETPADVILVEEICKEAGIE